MKSPQHKPSPDVLVANEGTVFLFNPLSARKSKPVTFADELEGQDSPVLAVLKHYGSPLTRDEYLAVSYLGEVGSEEEISAHVEETFPEQFRRKTLIETPLLSGRIQ